VNTSDSWPKLEAGFRQLSKSEGDLHANGFGTHWNLTGGPRDTHERTLQRNQFDLLARRAGIKAGVPNLSNARDGWLNCVRDESPQFTGHKGQVINQPCLASADTCKKLETREIELKTTAASSGPYGLRRDQYPLVSWLYDHSHEPLADPEAELAYWTSHIWGRFRELIEDFGRIIEDTKRKGDSLGLDPAAKLNDAIVGLSYDLAVLQANHVLDRGLRGESAVSAFRTAEGPLLEEIGTARRTSKIRWAVSDQHEEELARSSATALRRVGRDLQELLILMGSKEMLQAGRRERSRDGAFLKLVLTARPAAESKLRRAATDAIEKDLLGDRRQLAQVLWRPLSEYAETIFDRAAENRLGTLGSKISVGRYLRWLESSCIPAVVDDICTPMIGQFHKTVEHVYDALGEGRGVEEIAGAKRALAGLLTEVPSGPHTEDLESRLRTHLNARTGLWQSKAIEQASGLSRPEPAPVEPKITQPQARRLDLELIGKWMRDEGYHNKDLASALQISVRTVSSLRNNGMYHGDAAVTKLANLMNREVEDLYQP